MTKKIKAQIKLQIPGGAATPAPPVGNNLGAHQVNLMDFCKKFNAATASRKGEIVPVLITVYVDKTFDFVVKTPLVTELLCKKANIKKGSAKPGTDVVGSISKKDIEEIAKIKLPDLNSVTLDGACKIIEGSARSLGLKIVD